MANYPGTPIYDSLLGGPTTTAPTGSSDMWNLLIPAAISAFGAIKNAGAQNKSTKEQAALQREALLLEQQKEKRASESDILRKLAQTAYLRSGGASTAPPMTAGGRMLSQYGFGPRAASQEQMDASSELEKLLLRRMVQPAGTPNFLREIITAKGGR